MPVLLSEELHSCSKDRQLILATGRQPGGPFPGGANKGLIRDDKGNFRDLIGDASLNKLCLDKGIMSWKLKNRFPRQKLHI